MIACCFGRACATTEFDLISTESCTLGEPAITACSTLSTQAEQAQADADAKAASQEAEPQARLTAAERLADALKTHAPAPEGYMIRWPKPAFDLLKRTDSGPRGQPCLAGPVQLPRDHHPGQGHQGR